MSPEVMNQNVQTTNVLLRATNLEFSVCPNRCSNKFWVHQLCMSVLESVVVTLISLFLVYVLTIAIVKPFMHFKVYHFVLRLRNKNYTSFKFQHLVVLWINGMRMFTDPNGLTFPWFFSVNTKNGGNKACRLLISTSFLLVCFSK